MDRFISPIDGEIIKIDDPDNQKGKYVVRDVRNVLCPYDGEIVDSQGLNCKNSFKIKHEIGEDVFYSNFCNLDNQIYSIGHSVRQGKKIGETTNENLEYWITNKKKEKQNINSFFRGVKSSDKKEDKKEDKKQDKKQTSKSSSSYPTTPIDGKIRPRSEFLFATPFTLVPKIIKGALKEELNRIKELMK
jgi:hypothetical protein